MIIDKYLTSIANFIWKAGKSSSEDLEVYFHEMPESGKLPCLYFPNPTVVSKKDTLTGFVLGYAWYIKIFALSNECAYKIASEIQRALSYNRYKIPIINQDGSLDEFHLTVFRPDVKQIDTHTYQLSIEWKEYNHYSQDSVESFGESVVLVTSKEARPFELLLDDNDDVLTNEDGDLLLITTGG